MLLGLGILFITCSVAGVLMGDIAMMSVYLNGLLGGILLILSHVIFSSWRKR